MKFDCPRTCANAETCRFNKLFVALGNDVTVHSHTVKVRVELKDPESLRSAVEQMKGEWLGDGHHAMFSGQSADGFGFKLPGWRFPLVLDKAGELHFDDYNGSWGRRADIDVLKGEYTMVCATNAAIAQGWQVERSEAGLLIQHPSGGSLIVTAGGIIDANGFQGVGCHEAIMSLGMNTEWAQAKQEFGQIACEVQQGVG